MKNTIFGLLLLSMLCLISCDDPAELPPPGDEISESDLENASESESAAILDPESLQLMLTWYDRFDDEESFGIEILDSEVWHRLETLPQVEGVDSAVSWSVVIEETGQYRIMVDKSDYSLPLNSSSGGDHLLVSIPTTEPTLIIDSSEPLSGSVTISLGDASDILYVNYFMDLQSIASVSEGEDFSFTWNSRTVPNGVHLLSAMAATSPDVFLDLRRQIQVENPDLFLSMSISGTSGTVDLDVNATAEVGIESVESFLDDRPLGALTSPNYDGSFRWIIDTEEEGNGEHTIHSVATDRQGNVVADTLSAVFDQFPEIILHTPIAGSILSGTLVVDGELVDDLPGRSQSGWAMSPF